MEWISVKDKKPEHNQVVDIWLEELDSRQPNVTYLADEDEFVSLDTQLETLWICVSHWMPLPEPPKEKDFTFPTDLDKLK